MKESQALQICGCFAEGIDAGWCVDDTYCMINFSDNACHNDGSCTFRFSGLAFDLDDVHIEGDWLIFECGGLAFGHRIQGAI